jgi:predicted RNA binding protein with dsRBD fold (UPF0201 family)
MKKNHTFIPTHQNGDKQNVENYREICLLNTCYKIYSKVLNEKLKAQAEQFLLECQKGFQKGRSCIYPLFSMELLIEKRREFNLETHLAFLDHVKAFYKVKRDKLSEILQRKNISNLVLKSIIEIYSGNKIKVKINTQLSEEHKINHRVRQDCPLSPTLFNIYMNEIIAK